ncbi:ABC transporter permease [Paenibacillus thermoaerophilus]|uniref:ABC transporter permease n=1 Tax=Paenibacillus thermoaerophilus TaxID=1215385 RepID=A0ABW2UZK6_9BACL|nr:ABC transporter permease [Paenibacillus thermoaerophilus]TMV14350.1 ABC transporter permease [Paenibacillus thermoaerophilus]
MIWNIYLKELKDTLRDRKTLVLSILVPIVMIAAMSMLYEKLMNDATKEVPQVTVGVSDQLQPDTLQWLSGLEGVKIVPSADPKAAATEGDVQVALDIPADFAAKLTQGGSAPAITLYADQSSANVSRAVDMLLRVLGEKQTELVQARVAAAGVNPELLKPFVTEVKTLTKDDDGSVTMISMLFSLAIVMAVMLGGFPAAIDLFAGEKERKTMESLLITPVSRMKLIVAKWLAISTLGAASGIFAILAFVVVTKSLTEKMAAALEFGDQTVQLLLSAVAAIILFALLFATIEMMISIVTKSFKEAQNFISPVMFLALVPYFLLVGQGANEMKTYYFAIPFMNIFALLKELMFGIFSAQNLLLVCGSTALFSAVCFAAAYVMFRKDKWVLGK